MTNNLPLFVYGSLKPGELAFGQVKDFLAGNERSFIDGFELKLRDLMPLVQRVAGKEKLSGFVLTPKVECQDIFYETVQRYEGNNYELSTCLSTNNLGETVEVNLFVGRSTEYGGAEYFEGEWTGNRDPLLSKSFPCIIEDIRLSLDKTSGSFSSRENDWYLKNRKIGNFLLLNSILEHVWSMTFGGITKSPSESMRLMKKSMEYRGAFRKALEVNAIPYVSIRDSRDIDYDSISTRHHKGALDTWYRVRGNTLHRGKSGSDTEIIEDSSIGLGNFLMFYLESQVPGIRSVWQEITPNLRLLEKSW